MRTLVSTMTSIRGGKSCSGRASTSRAKNPGFESRDEQFLSLRVFLTNGASTGIVSEADIERD